MAAIQNENDCEIGLVIAILRTRRRWSQERLAQAAQVRRSAISDYERGKAVPEFPTLLRIVSAMGYSLSAIDRTREFMCSLGEDDGTESLCSNVSVKTPDLPEELDALATEGGRVLAGFFRKAFLKLQERREGPSAPDPARATPPAEVLLPRLLALKQSKRRLEVEAHAEFRDWRLSVLLSDRSLDAASRSPKLAAELAELAVVIAEHLEGEPARTAKVHGYALGHLGNARRAHGSLVLAEQALDRAEERLAVGRAFTSDLLEEARIPALRASLRLVQGRLEECLGLLDQALTADPSPTLAASILITKGRALEEKGDLAGTVAVFHEAEAQIERDRDPRLYLCVRQNLLDALSKADRFEEAAAFLPEVQRLSAQHASTLDRTRLKWIEGRIAAGQGDLARGIELLTTVRGALVSGEIGFDTALVSLELAGFYARKGNNAAVKTLAGHMAPIFQANVLHREALAAIAYFRQAADRKEVTAELTGKIALYLIRARHNPALRFEE